MDYIALEIIAQIDNLYAETTRSRISQEIPAEDGWQPYSLWSKKNLSYKNRKCWNLMGYSLYRVVNFFYASFYYYFYPLLVIILTYLVPGKINCETADPDDDAYCGPDA